MLERSPHINHAARAVAMIATLRANVLPEFRKPAQFTHKAWMQARREHCIRAAEWLRERNFVVSARSLAHRTGYSYSQVSALVQNIPDFKKKYGYRHHPPWGAPYMRVANK